VRSDSTAAGEAGWSGSGSIFDELDHWHLPAAAARRPAPTSGPTDAADRPPGKRVCFSLSRSGKWHFSAVGGQQTKKTDLKFKMSQKWLNIFKIALHSSEAHLAWSLHAAWVPDASPTHRA
jgi:hypothetical protein